MSESRSKTLTCKEATFPANIYTGDISNPLPTFELLESAALNTSCLISPANDFLVADSSNNPIIGGTITILNVTDSLGNDRTADFALQGPDGGGKYFPKTAGLFYFGNDANIRESYTFTFLLTNPSTGETNQILFNGQLSNAAPTISSSTVPCGGSVTVTGTASASVLTNAYSVVNGSADTTRNTEEITATVDNINFEIIEGVTQGSFALATKQGTPLATYTGVIVRFSDAGGLSVSCTIDVTVES